MRIALCTLLDDNFYIGFVGFWKSFIKFNSWFLDGGIEFVILDNGLSKKVKTDMATFYPAIKFIPVVKDNYKHTNFSLTADRLKNTYYTLDVFGLTQYDRIVFLDMDIVVLDDIKALFDCPAPIAGCQVYSMGLDALSNGINSGVFVINKPVISTDTYKQLLAMTTKGLSMPDQKIINSFFSGKIHYLDKTYNVEKRLLHTKNLIHIRDHPKIIHFVATKPWEADKQNALEASYGEWEKIWIEYYNS